MTPVSNHQVRVDGAGFPGRITDVVRHEAYSTYSVVRFTGATYRMVDYWARTKLLVPSIAEAKGSGRSRAYSFMDMLAIRTVTTLKDGGMSLAALKRVAQFVQGLPADKARNTRLVISPDGLALMEQGQALTDLDPEVATAAFLYVVDLGSISAELRRLITEAAVA